MIAAPIFYRRKLRKHSETEQNTRVNMWCSFFLTQRCKLKKCQVMINTEHRYILTMISLILLTAFSGFMTSMTCWMASVHTLYSAWVDACMGNCTPVEVVTMKTFWRGKHKNYSVIHTNKIASQPEWSFLEPFTIDVLPQRINFINIYFHLYCFEFC